MSSRIWATRIPGRRRGRWVGRERRGARGNSLGEVGCRCEMRGWDEHGPIAQKVSCLSLREMTDDKQVGWSVRSQGFKPALFCPARTGTLQTRGARRPRGGMTALSFCILINLPLLPIPTCSNLSLRAPHSRTTARIHVYPIGPRKCTISHRGRSAHLTLSGRSLAYLCPLPRSRPHWSGRPASRPAFVQAHLTLAHAKVGNLPDVHIVSVPRQTWEQSHTEIVDALRSAQGVLRADVLQQPKQRAKRGTACP
jgi:hypothetical protein